MHLLGPLLAALMVTCLLAPACLGQVASTTRPSPTASPLPGTRGAVCSHDQPCNNRSDLYCAFPNLLCGGKGTCQSIPDVCTLELRPVCGCNFQTYGNPCAAAAAGQPTFAFTACNASLKCSSDRDCANGFHCRFPAEQCSGVGLCSAIPDVCTLELNSVCGCNNQTYSNPCLAFSSGVSIQSFGECPVENAFACSNDSECGLNQYCRYDAGLCGGTGTCINLPGTCTLELSPVCGCNNVTYDNPCIAASAGVSLDSLSACQDILPCTNDTECAFGQYCRFDAGTCGGVGSCANAPNVCTLELNPVCGCDNSTYDNPCLASSAGASLQSMGSCGGGAGPGSGACTKDSDCSARGAGQYCQFRDGACGGSGVCVDAPRVCTADLRPVCGCDGNTYGNRCGAQAQGISILSATGGCPSPSALPA